MHKKITKAVFPGAERHLHNLRVDPDDEVQLSGGIAALLAEAAT